MKKLGKARCKQLLNAVYILGTIGIVVYLGARSGDIVYAWESMRSAKPLWIAAALACFAASALLECLVLHVFFRLQRVPIRLRDSLVTGFIGIFYSAVTPAATGGQPMQVFSLKKAGVPVGTSTSALAVKFFCWQCALLLMGGALWALFPTYAGACMARGKWIVIVGFALNGVSVATVLLLAISRNLVRALLVLVMNFLHRVRIVKDLARTTSRLDATLEDFHASVNMLRHRPGDMAVLLLLTMAQVAVNMSIVYCVYRSLGLNAVPYPDILTLQFLLFIAASFTPLPGASGAQEGGFYLFFRQIFPEHNMLGALLMWRFCTYYISIITGALVVVYDGARSMRVKQAAMRAPESEEAAPIEENVEEKTP